VLLPFISEYFLVPCVIYIYIFIYLYSYNSLDNLFYFVEMWNLVLHTT